MIKKIMVLAVSVAALIAFAAPAVAQAAELKEGKTKLAINSEVTATSFNLETATATGTLFCEKVTIHGTLIENGPNVVIAPNATTTENCRVTENGAAVTITNPLVGTITLEGKKTEGSATATFEADIPAAGLSGCHLSGSVAFTYVSGSDVFSIPGSGLTGMGPEGCPTAGSISGAFTLETANGTAVTINA
jgi:hypothetical protein